MTKIVCSPLSLHVFPSGLTSSIPPVIPSGFEPETHSLEGCCSIQLSYGTKSGCKITLFSLNTQIF